jgi:hypothetical protein
MRLRLAFATLIVLLLAVFIYTRQRGSMAEFSPYTLKYRVRSERTIFALNLPIYRSPYRSSPNAVLVMLQEEGFVDPVEPETDRWERVFHCNQAWRDGYGKSFDVLVRHRDAAIAWSREHPAVARFYWQEAFRLLRTDKKCDHWQAYEILSQCRGITDPEEMQRRMEEVKASVALDCPPDE